jgi:hypothetical protein
MPSLDEVKNVIIELISLEDVADHVCFFGGAMPYIVAGEQSGRNHSDIDVLVDEEYMEKIRQIAQEKFHYMPEQDSLAMGMNRDYGFKIFIDGVYVEFEPIAVRDGIFFHRSFSLNSKKAGEQQIPFKDIQDIMVLVKINGIKTYAQSNEMIRLSKAECGRPKDLADIAFIDSCGIDTEKYARLQEAISSRKLNIFAYEDCVM